MQFSYGHHQLLEQPFLEHRVARIAFFIDQMTSKRYCFCVAWKIESAVIRGEIDNTVRGLTTGKIWLIHQDEPILLLLHGNCWRDVAGCKLSFHLESPDLGLHAPALAQPQTGVVGDITVSRKGKNYHESPFAEDLSLRNFLYLEWFDQVNGRVLIETPTFTVEISERQWEFSVEDETAQKMKNLDAMRDFVCKYIQRDKRSDLWSKENADEFQWEKRFQESDRLTDAFQEVLEKYADDAEREIKQSYVMGWSSELDRQEDNLLMEEDISEIELLDQFENLDNESDHEAFPWDDVATWSDDDEMDEVSKPDHPLLRKTSQIVSLSIELLTANSYMPDPLHRINMLSMMISAKLTGGMEVGGDFYEQEPGYMLALLKRCLFWLNDCISACVELLNSNQDPDWTRQIEDLRTLIFEAREQITEMRRELSKN